MSALMAPIGGLMLTLIVDRYGRKITFICILLLTLAGWIVISTASSTNRRKVLAHLLIGRSLNGIAHGMSTGATTVYSSEVAHATIRGRISISLTIVTTIGILFIYVLGYFMPVSIYNFAK